MIKMKRLIIVLAFVLGANLMFANNDNENNTKTNNQATPASTMLTGKIIDQATGEALTGVKVEIEGTNQVVYTDFDGNFSFNSIATGEYNINVDYISYKANSLQKVNLKSDANSIQIELKNINQ